MISPFTDTFCISPNSEPKPTVHPALTLESLCEGHPVKPAAGIVGWETVLHELSARSCAIAAPPFAYGSGIFRVRSQIADRQTSMQVPAIHIQPGDVGAELNASKIFDRARVARDVAGDRPAEAYVPR